MGKTIFISSHILTELADICTSVGIIEKGRLLYLGGIEAVQEKKSAGPRMVIRLHREEPAAVDILRSHAMVAGVEARGCEISFEYRGDPADFHEVVKLLADRRVPILTIGEAPHNLERLFLEVTEGHVQ